MPRRPRFALPGIPQHVIQRGNNRVPCFVAEQDYRRYLDDLEAVARKHRCRIHAYVLMTNPVHMLVTPTKEYGPGPYGGPPGKLQMFQLCRQRPRSARSAARAPSPVHGSGRGRC